MTKTQASKKTVSKAYKNHMNKNTITTKQGKEALVLAEEVLSRDGVSRIGLMTLNSEKTMNAVDLEMVNQIDDVLARWREDDGIVAVIMRGAGDRAFSAGGDIRQIYKSMAEEGDEHLNYADAFFTGEYSKNYRVHLFGKPLIAWGNGFVMGGGLGLYIGANHKVGTEHLKLAWPEIRIGLFPDVTGSYHLSRLPFPIGHWMGLTGSQMNAVDCKEVGLINYCLAHDDLGSLIDELCEQPWQKNKAMNNQFVRETLTRFEVSADIEFPESKLTDCLDEIHTVFDELEIKDTAKLSQNKKDLQVIEKRINNIESGNDWFKSGKENFLTGCPGTAHLIMRQLQLGRQMTLKEVVKWELGIALQSVRHPDFAEGVRARVIEKDGQPKWQHESVGDVPESWIESLLRTLWSEKKHPFYEL